MNVATHTIIDDVAMTTEEGVGLVRWCTRILSLMCAITLLFIMSLTFVDVFMRYWFSSPITGSSEMVMFAMAILIFSSFPLVTLREQHISVGILHGKMHGLWFWLQRLTILLISFISCSGMTWQLLKDGYQLSGEQQATMVLGLPLGTLNYFMGVLSGVSALFLMVLIIAHVVNNLRGTHRSA